jgi:hypothetical protein
MDSFKKKGWMDCMGEGATFQIRTVQWGIDAEEGLLRLSTPLRKVLWNPN